MQKSFVRGTWQVKRAFSPAVITEGAGRMIFIAGHTGQTDDAGKSLAGDFDAQFRQTFRNIEKTLEQAGAKLRDMVTMTVFLERCALHHAHDRAAHRAFRQRFSRQRRHHGARLCAAGNDDRGPGDRGRGVAARGSRTAIQASYARLGFPARTRGGAVTCR